MQIIILAGGRGTRLGSMTNEIPKSMIQINGIPFLEILIKYLIKSGFSKIVLSVGYLSDKIENYFSNNKSLNVEITYSKENKPLGTGGAILNLMDLLENEFIVINGDTFLELDYEKFIDFSQKKNKLCTLVGFTANNMEYDFINNLLLDDMSDIKDYSKNKTSSNLNYVDAGIYFFKKESMKYFPTSYPISLENEIFPKLIQDNQMGGFVTTSKFYDIGTPEKVLKFANFLKNKQASNEKQHFNH